MSSDEGKDMSGLASTKSTKLIPRYTGPTLDEMTDEQRELRQEIQQTRPRTGINGPFGPWLAVPRIARPAQMLGRACRYETSLSFRESELVILLTGAKTKSHTEFDIHVAEALLAGVERNVIDAIPRDDEFSMTAVQRNLIPLLPNEREKAIVNFTAELLDTYSVSDQTYQLTKAAVQNHDSVLVEIISIAGYYTFVCYTLNVFRIPNTLTGLEPVLD